MKFPKQIADQQLPSEQLTPQSQQYLSQQAKKSNRKYSRISPEVKDKLIFLIVRNNLSIKQAAVAMKINYSSAKFIFNQYRYRNQKVNSHGGAGNIDESMIRVRKLEKGQQDSVKVRSTVGGKFESESQRVWKVEQIYQRDNDEQANSKND